MPVEMIGWIAPRVASEIIPAEGPPFAASVISNTARVHEDADFDRVLIGYFSDAPDGFPVDNFTSRCDRERDFLAAAKHGQWSGLAWAR